MPAELTELRVRDVTIKLHRAGRGQKVLFLHGAGGVPQWLPFFDALAELRVAGARASRLWRIRRPALDPLDVGPRDVLPRPRRGGGARSHSSDWQLARRLARRRDPDPRPLELSKPRPAGTRRHPRQGRAVWGQL